MTDHMCLGRVLNGALILALAVGLSAPEAAAAVTLNESVKLLPLDAAAGDTIGHAVAINGNTVIVSSMRHTHNGVASGAAYLYNASTGSQTAKLVPADGASNDNFGFSVAIDGSLVVVGALTNSNIASSAGAGYLFNANTGLPSHKLTALDGESSQLLGRSAAIDGGIAVVGSRRDNDNGAESGSAYLFNTATGAQIHKLLPLDGAAGDFFGGSSGISGNVAIIGAHHNAANGLFASGAAYLFDTVTGNQIAKLTASDGGVFDFFGDSVAIDGNIAIVSAPLHGANGIDSGAAYLFDVTTGNQIAKLLPNDGSPDDIFGESVAIHGGVAIVGAMGDDRNGGSYSGSAYLFDVATGIQLAKLEASDGAANNQFGVSVGIFGDTAVVGSSGDGDLGINTGSAYLFNVPLLGDLDGDGFVGITDLNTILANWNLTTPTAASAADVNSDGFVGIEDLNVVLGNWNAGTPPPAEALALVPEPGALGLFVVVAGSVVIRYRR